MPVDTTNYISPVWAPNLFANKTLFCTGGAGTICSQQVRAFVSLGGNACIIGRNVEKTESGAASIASVREGARVIGIGGIDVRDPKALEAAAERCVKELGGLDFAIAGAAGNFLAPMRDLSANAFKSVMDIDALGSYNTAKAVLPHLINSARKHGNNGTSQPTGTGGRLLFISATFHYTGMPLQAHVAAAKAAVDQISNATAIEYGPYGVTSNIITPGPIAGTEGMERLARSDAAGEKQVLKRIPLNRMGETREISDAMVYLFSEAGGYVNGATLVVDGGSWRTSGAGDMGGMEYPDFLLGKERVSGVKSGRREGKL